MPQATVPTFDDVVQAAARIRGQVHRTPIHTSRTLNEEVGAEVFLKCENLQRGGAFKFRGASNAVLSLTEAERSCGVATHSSGNHAQALALAAKMRGVKATIVMPNNAPRVKRNAVLGYGARVVDCEPTLHARKAALEQVVQETGAIPIPPYDDARIIAGQGTAALELVEQVPNLDLVLTPVGGGGLLGGTGLVVSHEAPEAKVIACEPELADDAARSFRSRTIEPVLSTATMADGLRTSLGVLNFKLLLQTVSDVVTVSEDDIFDATLFLLERCKLVVEPSGAVPVAALRSGKVSFAKSARIGVILSGGNVDLPVLLGRERESQPTGPATRPMKIPV